jgi:16S rRNA (cytosine1402-N4)-methyltransferase
MHLPDQHKTVMLNEAVDALLHRGGACAEWPASPCFVDATFGRGGHSRLLLRRLPVDARLIAFDKDPEAVATALSIADPRLEIRHSGFASMSELPERSLDGVLMDLGVSSPQIDVAERGFSFRADGPLDMRMDPTRGTPVSEWLRHAAANEIAEVIRVYGEERFAGPIARAIVASRDGGHPVSRTLELAEIVGRAVRTREAGQNPATRTFQALRIFINGELDELRAALDACLRLLRAGGRLVVISFHSLEDRIVKQFMAAHSRAVHDRKAPFAPVSIPMLDHVARLRPTEEEVSANPRARSAILRVAQRSAA